MKYLITIYNINNANKLLNLADGLVVGLKGFSTRETSNFTTQEFKEVSKIAEENNKELYISLKPMLYNEQIEGLKQLFNILKDVYFTGVIVGDIGYYFLLKESNVNNVIYHPETLLTNITDINEAFDTGFSGAFISKEIHLDDVVRISNEAKGKLFLTAHGYLNMFYSKRPLIENYLIESKLEHEFLDKQTLRLKEQKREGLYPIIEDSFGTHIYRKDVSTAINQKKELNKIDYFLIDSIFHCDEYALDILNLFKNTTDEEIKRIKEKYNESWDEGFLLTRTIYKRNE